MEHREALNSWNSWAPDPPNQVMPHALNTQGTDCALNCPACNREIENERKQLRTAIQRLKDIESKASESDKPTINREIETLELRYEFISSPGWPSRVWPDRAV